MNVPIDEAYLLPLVSTMFLPASLVPDENIVIRIRYLMRAPFLPDRVSDHGPPDRLSIFLGLGSRRGARSLFLGAGSYCGASDALVPRIGSRRRR
jgi:hypothetical protein